MKNKLSALRTCIKNMSIDVLSNRIEIKEFKAQIKQMELALKDAILSEVIDSKPRFSNELKRERELKLRLKENKDYQSVKAKMEHTEIDIQKAEIKIRDKMLEFRQIEILSRLGEEVTT